jgi:tight adherence protein B
MELILIGVGVLLGIALLIVGLTGSRQSGQKLVEERIGKLSPFSEEGAMANTRQRRSPLGDSLNRAIAGRGFAQNLQTQLARADLKFTVGEFLAVTAIAIIGAGVVVLIVSKSTVFAALGAVGGFFIPRIYVSMLQGRRIKMFNNQLSDTINLLVNSLRSGYSVLQAMEAVSREMPKPISVEFGRVVQEVQLGLTIEQALNNMLRRVTSGDLDLMVTAIVIQR